MLCEKCKIREATIQYTEVINGTATEHHFCVQCARESNFGQMSALFEGEFPFAKILSTLFGEESEDEKSAYSQIVCPTCGMTYQQFVESSEFGCPDCYEVFDLMIGDTIKQIHGSDTHRGKRPKNVKKAVPRSLIEGTSQAAQGAGGENAGADSAAAAPSGSDGVRDDAENGKAAGERKPAGGSSANASKIRALRLSLNKAVREEKYEEAARLRDEIRALEKGGGAYA